MTSIREKVMEIAGPVAEKFRFDLVDIEYVREGKDRYLRIFIDKKGGITIDDCQAVSEEVDKTLDGMNLIKESYILEVSSPGIDRPLKTPADFIRYTGQEVEIELKVLPESDDTVTNKGVDKTEGMAAVKGAAKGVPGTGNGRKCRGTGSGSGIGSGAETGSIRGVLEGYDDGVIRISVTEGQKAGKGKRIPKASNVDPAADGAVSGNVMEIAVGSIGTMKRVVSFNGH